MVIKKPAIKMVEDKDGNKTPVIQKFDQKYDEDDLILNFMYETEDEEKADDEDGIPFDESPVSSDDDNSWLDNL